MTRYDAISRDMLKLHDVYFLKVSLGKQIEIHRKYRLNIFKEDHRDLFLTSLGMYCSKTHLTPQRATSQNKQA